MCILKQLFHHARSTGISVHVSNEKTLASFKLCCYPDTDSGEMLQGNCGARSNITLLKDLEQSTAGRVEYPPLKPFQCVLVIDKPFLWNNNATLWLDNLFVAISRTRVLSDFSILQHGTYQSPEGVPGRSMYITSSTFVGEGRGSASALSTFVSSASFYIEGACCFAWGIHSHTFN
jgi:hypothetical protein